jgi:YidC/Oxa1 family membrane protein insertase
MYMVIANIFQTAQTIILSREPLPENLQKIVDAEKRKADAAAGDNRLPFEPVSVKKLKKEAEEADSAGVPFDAAAPAPSAPKKSSRKKKKASP